MSILEQLREKKKDIEIRNFTVEFTLEDYARALREICSSYDLALENALLKLKNRGVEIADLKHRLVKLKDNYITCQCGKTRQIKEVYLYA